MQAPPPMHTLYVSEKTCRHLLYWLSSAGEEIKKTLRIINVDGLQRMPPIQGVPCLMVENKQPTYGRDARTYLEQHNIQPMDARSGLEGAYGGALFETLAQDLHPTQVVSGSFGNEGNPVSMASSVAGTPYDTLLTNDDLYIQPDTAHPLMGKNTTAGARRNGGPKTQLEQRMEDLLAQRSRDVPTFARPS